MSALFFQDVSFYLLRTGFLILSPFMSLCAYVQCIYVYIQTPRLDVHVVKLR